MVVEGKEEKTVTSSEVGRKAGSFLSPPLKEKRRERKKHTKPILLLVVIGLVIEGTGAFFL